MKALFIATVCAAGFWVGATPAEAHHSMTGFDRKQTVALTGTIQEFRWENPHSSIDIDVPGKDGKVVTWHVEMTAPAYLARQGFKRTSVKKGDQATVMGNPLISGDPGALFVSIKLPDGQVLPAPGNGKDKAK
ncbi:MAG TPA: DUF6152 family protein [Bryobacteraceae bacterium]|jgi:hypothetical protein